MAPIHPPTDTSPVPQVWQSYESSRRGYLPIQVATRGAALYAGGFYTRERFIATLHFGSRSCRLGISSDRQSRQAAFQLHMLYLATSNNRGRFSCVIIQANTGVVHPPSLQQPLCRAEFNTGDHQSRLGEPSSRPDHPRPFLFVSTAGYADTGRALVHSSSIRWQPHTSSKMATYTIPGAFQRCTNLHGADPALE